VRASRLLELLLLLQLRGRSTAAELAAALEVSERTVYRDVEALAAAGVPVFTETGRRGGIRLQAGYEVGGLAGIDDAEARNLVLAATPGVAADLGLDVSSAVTRSASERLLIEPEEWFTARDEVPWLRDVARGVWEQRELRLDYRGRTSSSAQVVRPLGLVLKGRAWYLIARPRRGGDRMFRVSRIADVAVLDHTFERPEGFDLGDAWEQRTKEFIASIPRYMVEVRVAPASEGLLGVLQEGTPELPLPDDVARDAEGWARLHLRFERPHSAARLLLQLGAGIEVLDPPELRDLMAEAARDLAALYA
jgi:predicted DNA-binding transcriptional regulator YafY